MKCSVLGTEADPTAETASIRVVPSLSPTPNGCAHAAGAKKRRGQVIFRILPILSPYNLRVLGAGGGLRAWPAHRSGCCRHDRRDPWSRSSAPGASPPAGPTGSTDPG